MSKIFLAITGLLLSCCAFGNGQITVISPNDGDVLGGNNTMSFAITGAVTAVTVDATLTGPGGVIVHNSGVFTNIVNNAVNGSLPLNLGRSLPEGAYTLQVTATEGNNTYNVPASISVTVLLTPPKLLNFNPIDGAFVKGTVHIVGSVLTPQIKDWKIQVNGQDIPNNSGTTNDFLVDWDTTSIATDGAQTITITIRDQGLNTITQTTHVTLDRLAPSITVQFPRSDTLITAHSKVPVIIDVQDASKTSVSVFGIDVVITDMSHQFIRRVTRESVTTSGSNIFRWVGRVRRSITLPRQFILQVTAVDKAGNVGQQQQVVLTTTG